MVEKRDKKAQFYILAAIIVVLITISISSVATYGYVKSEPKSTKELGNVLKIESNNVIKYGVYNEKDMGNLIKDFAQEDFSKYFELSPDYDTTNITVVYGNKDKLEVVDFSKSYDSGVSLGNSETRVRSLNKKSIPSKVKKPDNPRNNQINDVSVAVSGKNYDFKLEEGQTFYFVIINYKMEEVYVETAYSQE